MNIKTKSKYSKITPSI